VINFDRERLIQNLLHIRAALSLLEVVTVLLFFIFK